jgi:hypothetical protein
MIDLLSDGRRQVWLMLKHPHPLPTLPAVDWRPFGDSELVGSDTRSTRGDAP